MTASAPVPVTVFPTPEAMGVHLAVEILGGMARARAAGRRYLLGCPGGRTPQPVFRALATVAAQAAADLSHVLIVMMDEYVLPGAAGYVYCPPEAHYSCHRFAREEIVAVLNAGLAPPRRVPPAAILFPSPRDPVAYDRHLQDLGGVDLFLVASGASDGHVAFNPPGSRPDSPSRIIEIAEATRRDNLGTFPRFASLDEVPRHGVSVGLGTIASLSREVVMLLHGAAKRTAAARLLACGEFRAEWPASFIYRCARGRILLDRAARGEAP